jgi:hypothetical protein
MNISKSKSMFSIIAILLLAGCSNKDDNNNNDNNKNNNDNKEKVSKLNGRVIDGYIRDGIVCVDLNNDNKCNEDEPSSLTDNNGIYDIDISKFKNSEILNKKLLVIGGIDNSSNKDFKGLMKSSIEDLKEDVYITPITTIVSSKVKNGTTIKQAKQLVADTLSLDISDINKDPLKLDNKKVFEIALKIQKTIEIFNAILPEDTKSETLNKIIETIGDNIIGNQTDIVDIMKNITYENELKDIEFVKTETFKVIDSININNNSTINDMIKINAILDVKKEKVLNKITEFHNDNFTILDDFDFTIDDQIYQDIEDSYSNLSYEKIEIQNYFDIYKVINTYSTDITADKNVFENITNFDISNFNFNEAKNVLLAANFTNKVKDILESINNKYEYSKNISNLYTVFTKYYIYNLNIALTKKLYSLNIDINISKSDLLAKISNSDILSTEDKDTLKNKISNSENIQKRSYLESIFWEYLSDNNIDRENILNDLMVLNLDYKEDNFTTTLQLKKDVLELLKNSTINNKAALIIFMTNEATEIEREDVVEVIFFNLNGFIDTIPEEEYNLLINLDFELYSGMFFDKVINNFANAVKISNSTNKQTINNYLKLELIKREKNSVLMKKIFNKYQTLNKYLNDKKVLNFLKGINTEPFLDDINSDIEMNNSINSTSNPTRNSLDDATDIEIEKALQQKLSGYISSEYCGVVNTDVPTTSINEITSVLPNF